MIRLYDYELSADCYKLRLLMSILGLGWTTVPVDLYPGRENESDWFLALNPLGQLPVIDDDGLVLRSAKAILVHLASQYDAACTWYPVGNPVLLREVTQWLTFAEGLAGTVDAARLHETFFYGPTFGTAHIDTARASAHRLFRILDEHLWFGERQERVWLGRSPYPTIADIACFAHVALSEEGGVSRQDYPPIRRWCDRFKRIEGFIGMPGVFPAGPPLA